MLDEFLLPTKIVCERLAISYDALITRTHTRNIKPDHETSSTHGYFWPIETVLEISAEEWPYACADLGVSYFTVTPPDKTTSKYEWNVTWDERELYVGYENDAVTSAYKSAAVFSRLLCHHRRLLGEGDPIRATPPLPPDPFQHLNRTDCIKVRVTSEQKEVLAKAAKSTGLSLSSWLLSLGLSHR